MNGDTWREDGEPDPASHAAATIRDDGAETAEAVPPTHGVLHLPSALAREWTIVSELAGVGAEADLLVVTNAAGDHRVVKIYRARVEPKTEVLARVGGSSFEHVVRLYDHGLSDGRWYELLEYITLGSLEDLVKHEGPRLDEALVGDILWELATAIEHLHEHAVVHRDIKPSNILVRTRSPLDLVLTDFGIASLLDQVSSRFTKGHRTVAYAAPETAAGEVSPAADWWSVGIILVEVLTGRHPFAAAQAGDLLNDRVIMSRLSQMSVDDLVTGVEGRWRDLCRGLLRRDAKNRWGFGEIERWRRNDATLVVATEETPGRHGLVPFYFAGQKYDTLPKIGAAFGANWAEARKTVERGHLLDWVKDELKDNEWRQFLSDLDRDCKDLDERVFRVCAKLDPRATPIFCGYPLDPAGVERLANAALAHTGDAPQVVTTLLRREILLRAADATGIERYRELHVTWTRAVRECEQMREEIASAAGPAENDDQYRDTAAAMLLASASAEYVATLRADAQEVATGDALECNWFTALGDPLRASPAAAFMIGATEAWAHSAGRQRRIAREAAQRAQLTQFAGRSAIVAVIVVVIGLFVWAAKSAPTAQPTYSSQSNGSSNTVPYNGTAGGGSAAQTTMTDRSTVAFVNEYYRLWNLHDFSTMYGMLGGGMQRKNPYGQYVKYHSLVTQINVDATATSDPSVVHVRIVSRDREKDGRITENVNEGQWYLAIENGQLKLSAQDVHDVTPSGSSGTSSNVSYKGKDSPVAANVAPGEAANLVSQYYRLWNVGSYSTMYGMLSARFRQKHPYDIYVRYHANVVSIGADVTTTSDPLGVDIRIVSRDREKDGSITENVNAGTWHLTPEGGTLKLDSEDIHEVK